MKCLTFLIRLQNKWKIIEEGCIMDENLNDDENKKLKLHDGWNICEKRFQIEWKINSLFK